jgi:hypothetical protein
MVDFVLNIDGSQPWPLMYSAKYPIIPRWFGQSPKK